MDEAMKAYDLQASSPRDVAVLKGVERAKPWVKANEILVRMHADSLNYRDIQILEGVNVSAYSARFLTEQAR